MPRLSLSCALIAAPVLAAASLLTSTYAEAARCPNGQIYRPSRGICISKSSAIELGIYHARPGRHRVDVVREDDPQPEAAAQRPDREPASSKQAPPVRDVADANRTGEPVRPGRSVARAEPPAGGSAMPHADLARRAERLAYAADPAIVFPPPPAQPTLMSPRPVVSEAVASRPKPSPYGGLVALDPSP